MAPFVPYFASVVVGVGVGFGMARTWPRFAAGARRLVVRIRRGSGGSRFQVVRPDELDWNRNREHQAETTFYMKPLGRADEMGGVLMLVRYPASEINPAHLHSEGHGMFVLQGELMTHRGTFGPGTFVWFPPHEEMWHGAGHGGDVVVLFSTGLHMTTRYSKPNRRALAA